MMTEDKKELMLSVVGKFKGEWPSDKCFESEDVRHDDGPVILVTHTKDPDYQSDPIGTISLGGERANSNYYHIITKQEFDCFVNLLFEGAPDDAEYYAHPNDELYDAGFYKRENGACFFASALEKDGWWRVDDTTGHNLIPRPRKQEKAELPFVVKIGEKCLISNCGNDFEECTPKYLSSEYAIVVHDYGEQHYHMKNVKFRPLKNRGREGEGAVD